MEEVIESYADNKRRLDYMPYHWLPDVSSVRMSVKPWSILFALFGIQKREDNATMFYIRYKNGKLNRYLLWTIRRLRKHIGTKAYWGIAGHVLRRSNVFFLVALKHVRPRWHRDMPFWAVLKLHKDYRKLAITKNTNLDFRRVYIEKLNKTMRGLGVPTLVWRLYLHQLNQLLVLAFDGKIDMSQHGFRPMQGTLTAWLDLLKNMNNYDNIYEFDYKGFFPSLEITCISDVLREYKVPEEWVYLIENINKSNPQLTKEDKADEFKVRQFEYISMCLETGNSPQGIYWEPIRQTIVDAFGTDDPFKSELLLECLLEGVGEYWELDDIKYNRNAVLLKYVEVQWALLSSFGMGSFYTMLCGVPQGAPTSPFLSILALDRVIRDDGFVKDVRYADDGVRMTNGKPIEPKETELMEKFNIKYAKEKCGWVKKEGKWLKNLKFLGLIYNAEKDELVSDTAKGKSLVHDKQDLLDLMYKKKGFKSRDEYPENFGSWESFIKGDLSGFILSRLYNGSWNLEDYTQSFKMKHLRNSWVGVYNKFIKRKKYDQKILKDLMHIKLNVFNSSSLCLQTALQALKEMDNKYKHTKTINKRRDDTKTKSENS